jgi:uncharacterized protein YbgA (DUF1722 family)
MKSLDYLEQNVRQLLEQHQELKLHLMALQEENQRQREEIIQTHSEIQQLKSEYTKLYTAHTILLAKDATQEDRARAKQKITNIILQLDKAIEALTQ